MKERATIQLAGDDAVAYCEQLARAIRGARLPKMFPDPKTTVSHIRAMSPSVHRGVYDGIEVDQLSGLPTYRIWARVQADMRVATTELSRLGARHVLQQKARAHDDPIFQKQLSKFDYYGDVSGLTPAAIGDVSVKVRRLASDRGYFHVVLDKLDVNGVYLRYAIDLAQMSEAAVINVQAGEELADQTEDLRGLVYKFAALNSEHTFAKLASLHGITVERVNKGTIGPVYFPWSLDVPPLLAPVIESGAWVATFTVDTAAIDIESDRWNDPIETDSYDVAIRKRFGFCCFRDRKFVTTRDALPLLRRALAQAGAKNIVYAI